MLTTWLVELYLNELGVLQDQGRLQERQRLQKDFHDMLRKDMLKVCGVGGAETYVAPNKPLKLYP